jgi:sugar transferase (PEP-CTERM system associated)
MAAGAVLLASGRIARILAAVLAPASRLLVVGTGVEAARAIRTEDGQVSARFDVVGFLAGACVDFAEHSVPREMILPDAGLIDAVQRLKVDEILIAARDARDELLPLRDLLECRASGVRVHDLTSFYERFRGEIPVESLTPDRLTFGTGFSQGTLSRACKRVFDCVSASAVLLLASPVMLLAVLAIKLDSPGHILYRQARVGRGGRPFICLKFRSMREDAESDGAPQWAVTEDARVTRVGRFLRRCRIDELPQLINVLRNDMSLIGPRPERPYFVEQFKAQIPFYDARHSVKPGITGWAQVRYRYGASVADATRKLQFDLYYVKNYSIFLDLLILIDTVPVVLFGVGAR